LFNLRHIVSLFAIIILCGCGFKPMHATSPSNQANAPYLGSIYVANISNREGQYLRNQLLDKLAGDIRNKGSYEYELRAHQLKEQIIHLGVRRDATSTRAQMRSEVSVQLVDLATDKIVLQRTLHATNSFNILNSQFSTQVTEQDSRERTLDDLARQIITQITLFRQRGGQ